MQNLNEVIGIISFIMSILTFPLTMFPKLRIPFFVNLFTAITMSAYENGFQRIIESNGTDMFRELLGYYRFIILMNMLVFIWSLISYTHNLQKEKK